MRSSVIGSRHLPSTTRRCRRIIGAKSRHLGVAMITSKIRYDAEQRHVRKGTLGCTRTCSVWVDVSPLSSCVARVVPYDQDIRAESVPRPPLLALTARETPRA